MKSGPRNWCSNRHVKRRRGYPLNQNHSEVPDIVILLHSGISQEAGKEALEQDTDILNLGRYVTQAKYIKRSEGLLRIRTCNALIRRLIQSTQTIRERKQQMSS